MGIARQSFFCITDNASNMKKCLNQISWLQRLSCTAHTIQLVVRKGLLAAEILIAHAKRLINFFTSPKQNERLLNAQKKTLIMRKKKMICKQFFTEQLQT